MSEFADHMLSLVRIHEHGELNDITDAVTMHHYYALVLWVYAGAIISGAYQ